MCILISISKLPVNLHLLKKNRALTSFAYSSERVKGLRVILDVMHTQILQLAHEGCQSITKVAPEANGFAEGEVCTCLPWMQDHMAKATPRTPSNNSSTSASLVHYTC